MTPRSVSLNVSYHKWPRIFYVLQICLEFTVEYTIILSYSHKSIFHHQTYVLNRFDNDLCLTFFSILFYSIP